MPATKKRIEAAAKAIRFLVPLDGGCEMRKGNHASWTPKGLAEVRWPKHFGKQERKLIRAIARAVLAAR